MGWIMQGHLQVKYVVRGDGKTLFRTRHLDAAWAFVKGYPRPVKVLVRFQTRPKVK